MKRKVKGVCDLLDVNYRRVLKLMRAMKNRSSCRTQDLVAFCSTSCARELIRSEELLSARRGVCIPTIRSNNKGNRGPRAARTKRFRVLRLVMKNNRETRSSPKAYVRSSRNKYPIDLHPAILSARCEIARSNYEGKGVISVLPRISPRKVSRLV